jgi:hypothetical protein
MSSLSVFFFPFRKAHAKVGKKAPKNSMTYEGKCTQVATSTSRQACLNVVKSETALEVCLLDNSAEPMSHLVINLDACPSCMPNVIPELDVLCIVFTQMSLSRKQAMSVTYCEVYT